MHATALQIMMPTTMVNSSIPGSPRRCRATGYAANSAATRITATGSANVLSARPLSSTSFFCDGNSDGLSHSCSYKEHH